jgi:hypothetical protein
LTTQILCYTECRRRTYTGFSAFRTFLHVLSQVHLLRLPILLPQTFSTCTGYLLTFISSSSLLNLRSFSAPHPPLLISSFVGPYTPSRDLRSINARLLTVPKYRLKIATRGFRVAAPTIFNSLPHDIRTASSLSVFTSHHKSLYFKSAFSTL